MKNKFLLLLFLSFCGVLDAQDIHFSQFYHSPQNINPALIGAFKGDYRAIGTYRSQWSSVPVPYTTFAGGGDGKLLHKFLGKGILSGGFQFNYDQAGAIAVKLTEVGIGASLAYPVTKQMTVGGGLQVTFANRNLDTDLITTASQYNGDQFDENLGTNEDIPNPSHNILRIGAGVNIRYILNRKKRTAYNFGFALLNLNAPGTNFKEGNAKAKVPARLTFYLDGWAQFHPKMDVKGHALWHVQGDFSVGTYAEFVVGSGIRYHLNLSPDKEKSIAFLTSYRFGDSLIPSIEFGWRSLTAAFSYDMNTSPFQIATNRRGGPEFSLIYIFTKVAPPPVFKACPVF